LSWRIAPSEVQAGSSPASLTPPSPSVIPPSQPLASGAFPTIRLRLLKIAVRIKETMNRIRLAFASNCPDAALFRGLVGTLVLRPM
jgi:hypothetical protein